MRLVLLTLAALAAVSGTAAATEFVVVPEGDATATVLAVTGDGNAFCGGTQCVAASLDGSAGCYGPYCAAATLYGPAFCQALVCTAASVFGDSRAVGRFANTEQHVFAISVFGDATTVRTRNNQQDYAISGTGDASGGTLAISLTGHATGTRGNAFVFSGCDTVSALCIDPA